jgi:transposase
LAADERKPAWRGAHPQDERDLLQEKLKAFLRKLFDAKSEARGTEQKDLFFNEAETLAPLGAGRRGVACPESSSCPPRKKRGRKPLDPALPREIVRHELPESERICAHDGAALVEIGVEISEQFDIIPQQVRVIQHQRVKYACPCCDQGIKVTPAPARRSSQGTADGVGPGLGGDLEVHGRLAALSAGGAPGALWRRPVAHDAGGEHRPGRRSGAADHQSAARPPARCRPRPWRRDDDPGAEGAGKEGADEELPVGPSHGSGPPIRLFGYAPGRGAAMPNLLYAGIKRGAALMSDGYEVYGGSPRQRADSPGLLGALPALLRRGRGGHSQGCPQPEQPATQFIAAIGELVCRGVPAKDLDAEARCDCVRNRAGRS